MEQHDKRGAGQNDHALSSIGSHRFVTSWSGSHPLLVLAAGVPGFGVSDNRTGFALAPIVRRHICRSPMQLRCSPPHTQCVPQPPRHDNPALNHSSWHSGPAPASGATTWPPSSAKAAWARSGRLPTRSFNEPSRSRFSASKTKKPLPVCSKKPARPVNRPLNRTPASRRRQAPVQSRGRPEDPADASRFHVVAGFWATGLLTLSYSPAPTMDAATAATSDAVASPMRAPSG